jgi:hypothetical protein
MILGTYIGTAVSMHGLEFSKGSSFLPPLKAKKRAKATFTE